MEKLNLSKEECLKQGYYDEKYFVYHADENGFLAIFDRETGEKVKVLKFKKRSKEK